jgi:hypothetical protein
MARPKKPIDPEQIRRLAMINCSYAEIAAVVGCDQSLLTKRFSQVLKDGREQGRSSLKRMMWEAAQKGNISMMIFLSKQMLGYSDKLTQQVTSDGEQEKLVINFNNEKKD